jgi:biotin transporter BioY
MVVKNGMKTNNLLLGDVLFPAVGNRTIAILKDIVLVLSLALATALAAAVKIETGIVPVTLQTLAVLMSGILFGRRIGAASQITYLLGGLAGIPWFAVGGGLAYIFSPTFGYIVGFIAAAYVVGALAERGWDKNFATVAAAMAIGSAIIYLFGCLWLVRLVPAGSLLAVGVYPFVLGDLLKIAAAGMALPRVRRILMKSS